MATFRCKKCGSAKAPWRTTVQGDQDKVDRCKLCGHDHPVVYEVPEPDQYPHGPYYGYPYGLP